MKAALIRLGIRGFNPKLKKAAGRLEDLRTPEDQPIPPNTLAELRRDVERRRLVSDQIRQIEHAWSSSPNTRASRARRCAGAWPKTTSSRGVRTCGAFPMSMASTSPAG